MAQLAQLGSQHVPGEDIAVKNFSGSDIPEGTLLNFDSSNPATVSGHIGVLPATTAATAFLVATSVIKAGGLGTAQGGGVAVCNAGGTIAVGVDVMCNGSSQVITGTATNRTIGFTLEPAVSGDKVRVFLRQSRNS